MPPTLSIVVPTLNEAAVIGAVVANALAEGAQVVVSDGGSTDGTPDLARAAGASVCHAEGGRGPQLDAGANAATGDVLLFLHADSVLPPGAGAAVRWAAATAAWGCFSVRIESADPRLRWCGRYMTARARLTGTATGDMGIWCTRAAFGQAGGFGTRRVGEDLDFCRRLRAISPITVLPLRTTTSARRWEAHGISRTMIRMWFVRGAFYAGAPDTVLRALYRSNPR